MKILAFGASLRKGSFSKMALQAAVAEIKKAGVEVEKLDLNDYPMPAYNWDLEQEGMPEVVEKFKAKIAEASGLLISSPEYNHSVPGYLKNKAKRHAITMSKLHMIDTGLACNILGIRDTAQLMQSNSFGGLLENFIYCELLKQNTWSQEQVDIWHFRDTHQTYGGC